MQIAFSALSFSYTTRKRFRPGSCATATFSSSLTGTAAMGNGWPMRGSGGPAASATAGRGSTPMSRASRINARFALVTMSHSFLGAERTMPTGYILPGFARRSSGRNASGRTPPGACRSLVDEREAHGLRGLRHANSVATVAPMRIVLPAPIASARMQLAQANVGVRWMLPSLCAVTNASSARRGPVAHTSTPRSVAHVQRDAL